MKSITSLTARQLRRAADIQERIETLSDELNDLLGDSGKSANGQRKRGGNRLSAAGRAAIVRAARARWARAKGRTQATRKGRRRMSAATKARLAELARARWKRAKAEGKSRL